MMQQPSATESDADPLRRRYTNLIEGAARDISAIGSSVFYALACGFALLDQPWLCMQLVVAFAGLMGICYFIKACFPSTRPDHVDGTVHANVLEQVDASSFPSAHSARAAAMAWVIGGVISNPWVIGGLGLTALLVGGSRIVLDRHRPIDVAAGYVIGSIAGAGVTRFLV